MAGEMTDTRHPLAIAADEQFAAAIPLREQARHTTDWREQDRLRAEARSHDDTGMRLLGELFAQEHDEGQHETPSAVCPICTSS